MALLRPRFTDGDRLQIEGVSVRLRVNARARHVSIRIDRARHEAVAVAPSARRLADSVAFARSRSAWMRERLADVPAATSFQPGEEIMVFGRPCRLSPDGRRPRLKTSAGGEGLVLTGCGDGSVELRLVAWALASEARAVFARRIAIHCATLGVAEPPRLRIADTRSRWGSCTKARPGREASIRLSWRLTLAPFAVADYVAAHECAHLIEANHGPNFWRLVGDLVGEPKPHRAWLRAHGARLHALA
jgi:predicted metal-dependent hydrolase